MPVGLSTKLGIKLRLVYIFIAGMRARTVDTKKRIGASRNRLQDVQRKLHLVANLRHKLGAAVVHSVYHIPAMNNYQTPRMLSFALQLLDVAPEVRPAFPQPALQAVGVYGLSLKVIAVMDCVFRRCKRSAAADVRIRYNDQQGAAQIISVPAR